MNSAEYMINQIIEKRFKIRQLQDEIEELESNFCGMEFTHDGDYAVINFIDGNQVVLALENEEGYQWNEMISIYELEELIK